jgi:arylsulfatase A-like enzyme
MSEKPNVVIIMTDQQRADLSRREGFGLDTTPFLDALAGQGAWFNRAYTSMPLCAPARVSMLTGRYPSAHRVRTNHNIEDAYYTEDLFDAFRKHGYSTGFCGKNHSHLTPEKADFWYECGHLGIDGEDRSPEEEAFDDWLKTTHFHMSVEAAPFPVECQIPYRLVSSAQRWIESVKDRPFLLWLSFPEPHNPYQVPEPYYSMFPPESLPPTRTDSSALGIKGFKFEWCRQSFMQAFPDYENQIERARANYLGMLRLLDDQVKRVVESLDRERTIIVFLSDHGDFVGEYGLLRKGPELPEPLVRIPLQFAGPGIRPVDGPHPAHVSICDIMPTLCEAVGIPVPDAVQGRSLWPLLTGKDYPAGEFASAYAEQGFGGLHYTGDEDLDPRQDGLIPSDPSDTSDTSDWGQLDCLNSWTQSGQMRMIRKGDWKLAFDMQGRGQLYNLSEDPSEMQNLYDRPDTEPTRLELLQDLLTWRLRVEDPLPLPRKRYVMKRDPRGYWTPHR